MIVSRARATVATAAVAFVLSFPASSLGQKAGPAGVQVADGVPSAAEADDATARATSNSGAFPGLAAAIERARTRGPQSLLAAAELRVAGSSQRAAGLPPLTNPYLEIFVDRSRDTVGAAAIQANLWLPIELSGQRAARVREVETLVEWKKTARSAAQAGAVGEAVLAWGEVLVAWAQVQHAIEGEKIARDEAAYVNGRFESKDATIVDKALADGEVAQWVSRRAEASLTYALAHARLAIATGDPGLGDPPADELAVDLPALKSKSGDQLARDLVAHSPALRQYQQEAEAFLASREKWDSEKYLPVNFILSGGRSDTGAFRFGGGLAWTFPVLRKNQGEIARAEAEADRAKATYAIAAAAIAARAKGFHQAYEVARQALEAIDKVAIPAAKAVVEASVVAWRAGKLELSRVFLARRDLAVAHDRRLQITAAGFRAYGDLAGLVGDAP
jgi:cobalt-zinc-cadmium efflux system outer membrane protein